MPSKKRDAPLNLPYLIRALINAGMMITPIEQTILDIADSKLCRISNDGTEVICDVPKKDENNEG